jgi:hypothetical protein
LILKRFDDVKGIPAMKPTALAFLAAAGLSFALPAAAAPVQNPGQSQAQTSDKQGESYDSEVGAKTSIHPGEQQAQMGSQQDHDSKCAALKQRSKQLWDQADSARDHGDFNQARDKLDPLNQQLSRECGK